MTPSRRRGLAVLAALIAWLVPCRAKAQLQPPGTLDVSAQGLAFGGTDLGTSHFESLSAHLFQELRTPGHLEANLTLVDTDGAFALNLANVSLLDARWRGFRFDASLGDVTGSFSLFEDQRNFVAVPYIFFRGAETRLASPDLVRGRPAWELTLFGGRAATRPEVSTAGGGFGGNATMVGVFAARRTESLDGSAALSYASVGEPDDPSRANLQLESRIGVARPLDFLAAFAQSFSSAGNGLNASSFRLGPVLRTGPWHVEALVRQSGPDFYDVPGRIVQERDKRSAFALVELVPRSGPAFFVTGQLFRSNLDDDPAVARFDGKTATVQTRFDVGRGSLILQAETSHSETTQEGVHSSSDVDDGTAEYYFPLPGAASGDLGLEGRRLRTDPAASGTDFDGLSVFGRFYGFRFLSGSVFATGRVERRFPAGEGGASWAWEATAGLTQSVARMDWRVQVAYNSSPVSVLFPNETNDRFSVSADVARRILGDLTASLGGTYQLTPKAPSGSPRPTDWQVRVGVSKSFAWGHTPKVRAGYEGVEAPRGAVLGRVFLDENENGAFDAGDRALEGIGVRLGGLEIQTSDRKGEFTFTEVPDGTYRLSVVLRTLSASFDATPPALEVVVAGGAVVRHDFRIVRVGLVRGKVLERVVKGNATSLVPYGGALVRLKTGAVTLTSETDEDGRYAFESVPPGEFVVTVDLDSLPERAHVVTDAPRGRVALGAEFPATEIVFEVAPVPEEILRFPEAPPPPPPPSQRGQPKGSSGRTRGTR
jgi:hypothetical protein